MPARQERSTDGQTRRPLNSPDTFGFGIRAENLIGEQRFFRYLDRALEQAREYKEVLLPAGERVVTREGIGTATGERTIRVPMILSEPIERRYDLEHATPLAIINLPRLRAEGEYKGSLSVQNFCKSARVEDFEMAASVYDETWPTPKFDNPYWNQETRRNTFAFRSARALSRLRNGELFFFGDDDIHQNSRRKGYEESGALNLDTDRLLTDPQKLVTQVAKMWHGRFGFLSPNDSKTEENKSNRIKNAFQELLQEFGLSHEQGLLVLEQFHETLDRTQMYNMPIKVAMFGGAIGGTDAVDTSDCE